MIGLGLCLELTQSISLREERTECYLCRAFVVGNAQIENPKPIEDQSTDPKFGLCPNCGTPVTQKKSGQEPWRMKVLRHLGEIPENTLIVEQSIDFDCDTINDIEAQLMCLNDI